MPPNLCFEVRLGGAWQQAYDAAASSQLAIHFAAGKATSRLQQGEHTYDIDFRTLAQTNVKTGKTRPLRVTSLSGHAKADQGKGEIIVTALEAKGLKNMDMDNMDPYLRVMLGPAMARCQAVKKGGSTPVWTGDLGVCPAVSWVDEWALQLEVWDEDIGSVAEMFSKSDDFVGRCVLHIPSLVRQGTFEDWLPVFRGGAPTAYGELKVRVECKGIPDKDTRGLVQQLQVMPGRVWRHQMAGIVHILEGESAASFTAYAVRLDGVPNRFGDMKCDNYDAEHAVIFESSPKGKALRTTFTSEHNVLFRDGSISGSGFDMTSAKDFLSMLKGGWRRNLRRVFTYIISDDGIFFTETGIQRGKDTLSKHVVLANAAASVRCAGTFRVCIDRSVTPEKSVIVIDNDSGTYRPSGAVLDPAATVLKANIPGLEVRGLNVLEDQPEETKQYIGPCEDTEATKAVYKGKWKWLSDAASV